MPKMQMQDILAKMGFHIKSVAAWVEGMTVEDACAKISKMTGGKVNTGPPTIIRMFQKAKEKKEIPYVPIRILPKGKKGKASIRELMEKEGIKLQPIFDAIKGMTPEEAVQEFANQTNGKFTPGLPTLIKMIEHAIEKEELPEQILNLPEKKKRVPPPPPKAKREEAPEEHHETYPTTLTCTDCDTRRNENTDAFAACGKHVVLGLLARRCHGCNKFGTLKAQVKVGDIIVTKALIDGNEEFVDNKMNVIENPLMPKKETAAA